MPFDPDALKRRLERAARLRLLLRNATRDLDYAKRALARDRLVRAFA